MLRPRPARWFEVLVAHADAPAALAALAAKGGVELESPPATPLTVPLAGLRPLLERYAELARQYQAYWPAPRARKMTTPVSMRDELQRALGRLSMWHDAAAPVVRTLQTLEHEAAELDTWRALLEPWRGRALDLGLVSQDGPVLARRLYLFSGPVDLAPPASVALLRLPSRHEVAILVIGPPAALDALHRQAVALKGRALELPRWLHGRAQENLAQLERRHHRAQHGIARLRQVLARLGESSELAQALADIERLRWFVEQVPRLAAGEHFAWLSGWTGAREERLRAVLGAAGVRALIRFPSPPEGLEPPLILRNPWWARPFELFARALGVPGRAEVDPSPLLAVIAPLLFGYMFADVGHGLVLLLAGLALSKRYPFTRLLVAGGLASMVFGQLFGSVFAREDLIPAVWLRPLEQPFLVLGLPLLLGAVLLAFGMLLNGLEAFWRGEFRRWLFGDAGLFAAYAGTVAGVFFPWLFWIVLGGVAWYLLGHVALARRASALASAAGHLLEQAFQLAVNTISFARVGAFALAHAGLGAAIVALAGIATTPLAALLVLIVGNALMIALEALVASIQTTRLVLFEFFIRFLRASGRPFRPLPAPPSTLQQ